MIKRKNAGKIILTLCNVFLITAAIVSSLVYSGKSRAAQTQLKLDAFCNTIESMKQVSANYLKTELGYAEDWANYIRINDMTMDEALDFIRTINTQSDRYAHIVDMDTLEAYSTYSRNGSNQVSCYQKFLNKDKWADPVYLDSLNRMFSSEDGELNVLGKYQVKEQQINVVSVGTRITLRTESGQKDYLLLRLIPVESMKKIWVFPVGYDQAEIGMITKSGSYVVQSGAMKSATFLEFIAGYNFTDDYREAKQLAEQLSSTDKGLLLYKNSKNEECYWYYSSFGGNSGMDILGYIPKTAFQSRETEWMIVLIICGSMALVLLIDGNYMFRMNRRLRETAEEAKQASKAKTSFLSSMSHDIRTPMNAVLGMTDIAKRHVDEPQVVADCLQKISLAGGHLLTLINDILDISKAESGRMVLNPAEFGIRELFENLVNVVHPQIKEKKLEFNIYIRDFKYERLVADELRLNQIYINLLTNAVKYTNAGGEIRLEFREEEIPEKPGMVRLIYQVEDSGVGMSEAFQKRMYESFSRASDSRIDKIQGSGLGLAIVKQMVELMNGTITCRSVLGEGTCFTVCIDVKTADQAAENSRGVGERVMVVSTRESFLESAGTILRDSGAQIFCTAREEDAVLELKQEAAAGMPYSVVLIDYGFIKRNGICMISRLREQADRKQAILLIAAWEWPDMEKEVLEAGADGGMRKPFFSSSLFAELERLRGKNTSKQQEDQNADSGQQGDWSGMHVLVAEDNDLNWEIISELLGEYGISSERAENGAECVRMAEGNTHYDVIFMDIQMPEMNGREAARRIRRSSREDLQAIPIIAMTADAFAEDVQACIDAGMDGHISKPLDMKKVLAVLTEIKRRGRKQDEGEQRE